MKNKTESINNKYIEEVVDLYNVEKVEVIEVDDSYSTSKLFNLLEENCPIIHNKKDIRPIIQRRFDLLLESFYGLIFAVLGAVFAYAKINYNVNCDAFMIISFILFGLDVAYSLSLILVPIILKKKK